MDRDLWFVLLLIASGVLLIFNGGPVLSTLLWAVFLGNCAKDLEGHTDKELEERYGRYFGIGIIVVVASIIFHICT